MNYGLFSPSLKFEVPDLELELDNINEILTSLNLDLDHHILFSDIEITNLNIAQVLLAIMVEVRNSFECGLFNSGTILKYGSDIYYLFIPCLEADSGRIVEITESVFLCLVNKKESFIFNENLQKIFQNRQLISRKTFKTSNTNRFLISAQELGCPFRVLERDFILFGLGYYGVILNSTFTQNTSWIGNSLAKDKLLCSNFLDAALFPTTKGSEVDGYEDLIAKANEIGYPVVIKPRALDGGSGVFPNLMNQKQLEFAYSQTSKLTKDIIIEPFFRSNDYRIVVYAGEVVWAIERRYPGVTADGKNTISKLIEIENQRREMDTAKSSVLSPLLIDTETVICLRNQDLELESIPESGKFIRIRDKSNINVGGVPVSFPTNEIHDDNVSLACDVVTAIGLDLAGVDFLIEDLGKSWKEIGGVICEINAQPSLGYLTSKHLYSQVLQNELYKGFSPNLTVCLIDLTIEKISSISILIHGKDLNNAIICDNTAYIGEEVLNSESKNCFELIEGLLRRRNVRNILVSEDFDFRSTGLPCMNSIYFLIPGEYFELSNEKRARMIDQIEHFLPYIKAIYVPSGFLDETKNTFRNIFSNSQDIALIPLDDI